jgi:uncharacterized membrane protein YhaH (DUF805 family)
MNAGKRMPGHCFPGVEGATSGRSFTGRACGESILQGLSSNIQWAIISRRDQIEFWLFILLGLIFLAMPFCVSHWALIPAANRSAIWEKRSEALRQLSIFYGGMFLCLGILDAVCVRRAATLSQSVWSYFSPVFASLPKLPRELSIDKVAPTRDLIFIAVVLLVGAGSRAYFLAAPMKWDESRTFDKAYGSFLYGLEYDEPNNHVLNTLLERVSISTFGPNPLAGRLPAYVCGVAAIPLILITSRAIMPGGCGYFAAAAVVI